MLSTTIYIVHISAKPDKDELINKIISLTRNLSLGSLADTYNNDPLKEVNTLSKPPRIQHTSA